MNKHLSRSIIATVLILIVLILIIAFVYSRQPGAIQEKTTTSAKPSFTSMEDAMSKSLSLKCSYQIGDTVTTAYIKNNMFKIIKDPVDKSVNKITYMIIKNNKMWLWQEGDAKGVISEALEEDDQIEIVDNSDDAGKQEIAPEIKELEKYKDTCSQESIEDSVFILPSDITFEDIDTVLQEMQEESSVGTDASAGEN